MEALAVPSLLAEGMNRVDLRLRRSSGGRCPMARGLGREGKMSLSQRQMGYDQALLLKTGSGGRSHMPLSSVGMLGNLLAGSLGHVFWRKPELSQQSLQRR